MEILLRGTAAAEGWPSPFCTCVNCLEARRRGGPSLRGRAGALIDNVLKIDFGPDTLLQMQQTRRNLSEIKTILFTHQHADHLVPTEMAWMTYVKTPLPWKIEIWGNKAVLARIEQSFPVEGKYRESVELRRMEAGDHFTTADGSEVWALPAQHVEGAIVPRIRRNGKTLFYGHDSGFYPKETLDALADGITLDIALLDCTSGGLNTINSGHMCVGGVLQMVEEFRRRGIANDQTRFIATHFSHHGGLLHEELSQTLLPHRIQPAFDGMVVQV
jgi:phosphoribosyl 1,2-cyclic phosphate phosphodiesterase